MICESCESKGVARGIRQIACINCGVHSVNYSNGTEVCSVCSDKHNICLICGVKYNLISLTNIEHVEINKQGE